MKEKELRECATCAVCGKKIGKTGMPMFWRVRIERHGIDGNAMRRQIGLEMMLGSVAIAQAMGPDEDMTTPLMEPVTFTVCEDCCTKQVCVAELAELGSANTSRQVTARTGENNGQ